MVVCWLWMNSRYVGIGGCLNLNVLWHNHNRILVCYPNTQLCTDDVDVNWIQILRICGMVSCWFWTNRMYVGIGACLNLNLSLPGVRCAMIRSQLHTQLLFKRTTRRWHMAHDSTHADFDVDWIYGTVSCWLWMAASTSVLVHVWIQVCHSLVYDAPWHNHNYVPACYSNKLQRL